MATRKEVKSVAHEVIVVLFDRGLLFIAINNIGERAAVNVSVNFDQKFTGLGGSREISKLALFRSLHFLGPQREIVTLFDSSASYFRRKQPVDITARISYQDADSRPYKEVIRHNLEVFRELVYLDQTNDTENYPEAT